MRSPRSERRAGEIQAMEEAVEVLEKVTESARASSYCSGSRYSSFSMLAVPILGVPILPVPVQVNRNCLREC